MLRGSSFECFASILLLLCFLNSVKSSVKEETELKVITVATEGTDGFYRFIQSAKKYDFDVEVLGMGQKWEGGDIQNFPGGGQKILLLRDALEKIKHQKDLLVMFVDSYDVVFVADQAELLQTFRKFGARVLFSAEGFCWPNPSLAAKYPEVKMTEKRYLNSGGFIGYAPELYEIVQHGHVEKDSDDQLYYTEIFLDAKLREKFSMKLDTKSEIFQNLNGVLDDVDVKFKGPHSYLYNMKTGNTPIVLHGNGPIKTQFNRLTDYVGDRWTPHTGCQDCKDPISLTGVKGDDFPRVFLALFLEHPTAFVEEFFGNIHRLEYPREKIDLFIHYADDLHEEDVHNFMTQQGIEYNSVRFHRPTEKLNDWTARNKALEECASSQCQYFFAVDGDCQIDDSRLLQTLIERNKSAIAPLVVRPGKMWSNFWGALSGEGFYKRSDDYIDIIQNNRRGVWNVPYISTCYLIQGHHIRALLGGYIDGDMDADMAIAKRMRESGMFMYVDNKAYYGHLIDSENYVFGKKHSDLFMLFDNTYTWEKKYISREYYKQLDPKTTIEQPCNDVFWMPIFSPVFCKHLIEEMEHLNNWSGGKHEDPRLAGGYENVPTVDTHTRQIGWEKHWLEIIRAYIGPLNAKVFEGYFTEARASMNFVVRYKPTEQDRLRPHSDSSTYTVNMALNRVGIDYEGGGVRFLRQNCTVTELRVGWVLMHPGRLTHHHEGLPTTKGTRYIMVSFIDP